MKKVLILDDDHDLCLVMSQMFEALGAENTVAVHSLAELQTSQDRALHADLALLDVNLGENAPTGVDAYYWLRDHGFHGQAVFFTGHARSNPLIKKALEIPNVKLLEKPAPIDAIEALLK